MSKKYSSYLKKTIIILIIIFFFCYSLPLPTVSVLFYELHLLEYIDQSTDIHTQR